MSPPEQVVNVVFLLNGGVVDYSQDITFTCDTVGVSFRYTTDGSDPISTSTEASGGAINLLTLGVNVDPCTVKVVAMKSGFVDSPIVTAVFQRASAEMPTMTPDGENVPVGDTVSITLNSATAGVAIYYTTTGDPPTALSTLYVEGTPIQLLINADTTVKAIAIKVGLNDSPVKEAIFIKALARITAIFMAHGNHGFNTVVLNHAESSTVAIHYTTDRSDPVVGGIATALYDTNTPVVVTTGTVVKARVVRAGSISSLVEAIATFSPANTLARVTKGSFTMGSDSGRDNENPPHEVTQEQWRYVMGGFPAATPDSPDNNRGLGENHPMYFVSWCDAVEYCNALSVMQGLEPCYAVVKDTPATDQSKWSVTCDFTKSGYRLPTEAEWEYAAKEGSSNSSFAYAGSDTIGDVAWHAINSGGKTNLVTTKNKNALGLFDMSGNVWEWCWDRYYIYSGDHQSDPVGPDSEPTRVMRGGSRFNDFDLCRVAFRIEDYPAFRSDLVGFRTVRMAP